MARREPSQESLFADASRTTYSVSELANELTDLLAQAYPAVWVKGEIQRIRQGGPHLYFELVEKGYGDEVRAKLDVALFRQDRRNVERRLREMGLELAGGQTILCRCEVNFWAKQGRLQLIARDVDPLYGLGLLEKRRRETLAWLEEKGLLERNRGLSLGAVPLDIGLVTSKDSAAYADFMHSLEASDYGFKVVLSDASVQGERATKDVTLALTKLARYHRERSALDCIVVVRGGGSRTDLAAFDARSIAEAIAMSPVPVLTGIGHETDDSIADRVAYERHKTPTGVSESLVARVRQAEATLELYHQRLAERASTTLRLANQRLLAAHTAGHAARAHLATAERTLATTLERLAAASRARTRASHSALEAFERRLSTPARRQLERGREELSKLDDRLAPAAARTLERATAKIEPLERLCKQLSPARVLERGFSITRDSMGRLVRDPSSVSLGEVLHTELAGGTLTSRAEAAANKTPQAE